MNSFITTSEKETIEAGADFAKKLQPGDIVCLSGDLGAGKTHFIKGVALHFGINPNRVSSPTYTIIHEYSGKLPVYHFDCYRLESAEEALEVGAEEYFYGEGVSLIEWPEKIRELIPQEAIWIKISHISASKRKIDIHQKKQHPE